MKALRRVLAALRGFARGFLGLRAPVHGAAAARREIEETARRRPHCC